VGKVVRMEKTMFFQILTADMLSYRNPTGNKGLHLFDEMHLGESDERFVGCKDRKR